MPIEFLGRRFFEHHELQDLLGFSPDPATADKFSDRLVYYKGMATNTEDLKAEPIFFRRPQTVRHFYVEGFFHCPFINPKNGDIESTATFPDCAIVDGQTISVRPNERLEGDLSHRVIALTNFNGSPTYYSEEAIQIAASHHRFPWPPTPQATATVKEQAPEDRSSSLSAITKNEVSLLKLVIGMAVAGYRYDPAAKKSQIPAEIATDLQSLGLSMDPDTVRKWLKKAAEHLPAGKE